MLDDDDVFADRGDRGVNLARVAFEELLVPLRRPNGGEERIARADLRHSGPKADLRVDDRHAAIAASTQDAGSASCKRVLLVSGINRHDPGLHVHAEHGSARRVQRRFYGHWPAFLCVYLSSENWYSMMVFNCS